MTLPRIGVIGGGPSAVCLLDALAADSRMPNGKVTVFETSSDLWRGRPYRSDFPAIRVNAIPQDMSVRAGDAGHFQEWLTTCELLAGGPLGYADPVSHAPFVPRAVYGDYLEQSARSALMTLVHRGWEVSLVRQRIDAAVPGRHGIALWTTASRLHNVDYVVLGFGAGSPADAYSLAGNSGFIAEPYPTETSLADVDPMAEVAVLGSGLSAIDVVLALASRGHRGPIRLYSRNGVLPAVRQRPISHGLQHFTAKRFQAMALRGQRLTLESLVSTMETELLLAGERLDSLQAEVEAVCREDPIARLRRQLHEVNDPGMALRIMQQAVPDAGPDIWPLLVEQDKDFLLTQHYRTLMSLCCPMPPGTAQILLSLVDSGQLELVSGVEKIAPCSGGFSISTTGGDHRATVVVNAMNARLRSVSEATQPVIKSMVQSGVAELHPHGGLSVERATSRLTVGSQADPRFYALGDPCVGSLFFTFGIQSLVDRAVDIVDAIGDDIRSETLAYEEICECLM